MVNEVYAEAIAETLDILEHTRKEDVDKISPQFIDYLKNNASKNYISNLDHSKNISDMNLKVKTKVILAIIYRKFWCSEEQKIKFDNKMKDNELEYQKEIREKYNPDNVFRKQQQTEIIKENTEVQNVTMVEYKETLINKIINKIKMLFFKS